MMQTKCKITYKGKNDTHTHRERDECIVYKRKKIKLILICKVNF